MFPSSSSASSSYSSSSKTTAGPVEISSSSGSNMNPVDFPTSLSYDTLESSLVHKLNTIQRNVDIIQSRLKLLGTLHDTPGLKHKLDQVQLETTILLQQSATDVKQLTQLAESTALSQNKLAARRMVTDLSKLTSRFQMVQQNLLHQYKLSQQQAQQQSQQLHSLDESEPKESTPLLAPSSTKPYLAEPELQEIKYNDTIIAEREAEIRQIEQGVLLVNDVFKKIGNLVQDQGQLFDHIETNLQNAQVHIESADNELVRANKRSEKWNRFKCWVLIILVIVFFMFVLIHLIIP